MTSSFLKLPLEVQFNIFKFSVSQLPEFYLIPQLGNIIQPLIRLISDENEPTAPYHMDLNPSQILDYSTYLNEKDRNLGNTLSIPVFVVSKQSQCYHQLETASTTTPQFFYFALEDRSAQIILQKKILNDCRDRDTLLYLDLGCNKNITVIHDWPLDDIFKYTDCSKLENLVLLNCSISDNDATLDYPWNLPIWANVTKLSLLNCEDSQAIDLILSSMVPNVEELTICSLVCDEFDIIKQSISKLNKLQSLLLMGISKLENFQLSQSVTKLEIVPPELKDVSCYSDQQETFGRFSIKKLVAPNLRTLQMSLFGHPPVIEDCITPKLQKMVIDGYINHHLYSNSLARDSGSLATEKTMEIFSTIRSLEILEDNKFVIWKILEDLFPSLEELITPIIPYADTISENWNYNSLKSLTITPGSESMGKLRGKTFPNLEHLGIVLDDFDELRFSADELCQCNVDEILPMIKHFTIKACSTVSEDKGSIIDWIMSYFAVRNQAVAQPLISFETIEFIDFPFEIIFVLSMFGLELPTPEVLTISFSCDNQYSYNSTVLEANGHFLSELEQLVLNVNWDFPSLEIIGFTNLKSLKINGINSDFTIDESKDLKRLAIE